MISARYGRREILKLSAAAGLTALAAGPARSAAGPVVLGTWGGDTEKALGRLVTLAKEKHGIDMLLDVGTPSARKTKLIAQAGRPKNSMDIPWLVDSDMYQMNKQNILLKLDRSAIPNYDDLIDEFKGSDYALPTMYSALVLVYNKNIKAPKKISDLWAREYHGKVGFADLSYDKIIPMAAVAHGGSTSNYQPGYDALLELKKQGARVYPSNEAVGNAFQNGQIQAAIMWKGRGFQWTEAGLPLAYADPEEGAYPVFFEMGITRNSGFPKEAATVLGGTLEPEVQRSMALAIGQVPTTKNSGIAPDVEAKIGFSAKDRAAFIKPNHEYAAAKAGEALDFWNQKFKA